MGGVYTDTGTMGEELKFELKKLKIKKAPEK